MNTPAEAERKLEVIRTILRSAGLEPQVCENEPTLVQALWVRALNAEAQLGALRHAVKVLSEEGGLDLDDVSTRPSWTGKVFDRETGTLLFDLAALDHGIAQRALDAETKLEQVRAQLHASRDELAKALFAVQVARYPEHPVNQVLAKRDALGDPPSAVPHTCSGGCGDSAAPGYRFCPGCQDGADILNRKARFANEAELRRVDAEIGKLKETLAASEAGAAAAREALEWHVKQYGGSDHHPDDCPDPRHCDECIGGALVTAALTTTAGAKLALCKCGHTRSEHSVYEGRSSHCISDHWGTGPNPCRCSHFAPGLKP